MGRLMGGMIPVLKASDESISILVNAADVVYSKAFPMSLAQFFGIWVRATSVLGTPDIKIELEEGNVLPTTEGSAETTRFVVPDGMSTIFDQINDELAHIKTVSPIPMAYGRYKITGINANPADTLVQIQNFIQEPV